MRHRLIRWVIAGALLCPSATFANTILETAQSFAVLGGAGVTVAGGGTTLVAQALCRQRRDSELTQG